MNKAEREPLEQIDYGIGYKGHNSPQQHMNLKVDGGAIAIAIALVAIGAVVASCILLPQLMGSIAREASAAANINAQIAEREARIAQDKYTYTMGELAKQGIIISTDGH